MFKTMFDLNSRFRTFLEIIEWIGIKERLGSITKDHKRAVVKTHLVPS
jgi:hypothetical protein